MTGGQLGSFSPKKVTFANPGFIHELQLRLMVGRFSLTDLIGAAISKRTVNNAGALEIVLTDLKIAVVKKKNLKMSQGNSCYCGFSLSGNISNLRCNPF